MTHTTKSGVAHGAFDNELEVGPGVLTGKHPNGLVFFLSCGCLGVDGGCGGGWGEGGGDEI